MSPEHLFKKSFGSVPCCLLVRLSGSYIVLAANGPRLPIFPPSHPLLLLCLISSSHPLRTHTHQLLCLFSSAVAIFPSVIDIILGVRSSLFCVSYFGGGQWGRWVASLSVSASLRWCCGAEMMDHSSLRMSHLEIMATDEPFPLINASDLIECFSSEEYREVYIC